MATYVDISREEIEQWLDDNFPGWLAAENTAGVYLVCVHGDVAIKMGTTLTGHGSSMPYAQGSMKLSLVSTYNGRTLNKKAMGQAHFKRTTNWRTTWRVGVERMLAEYYGKEMFYNRIARTDDDAAVERRLAVLRKLWLAAANAGDQWTKEFVESVAASYKEKASLSDRQLAVIQQKLEKYGVLHE